MISINAFSQNPIEYNNETINYIDEHGIKQGIWKIYSPDDDQAPKGEVYVECNFINGKVEGHVKIKKGRKTLIEISPIQIKNKTSFKAKKGLKKLKGYITRGKETVYFEADGNRFSKEEQDWLRKHTQFLAMHYTGSLGMKKNIKQIFEQKNIGDEKGRIVIKFTVDLNGYIINPEVMETDKKTPDEDDLLEKEALRIIKLFPRMQPAFQTNRIVKLDYYMPFNFK